MSIEYRSDSGIGYKVYESDELAEQEDKLEDGLEEYINGWCMDGFSCFEVGDAYSGSIEGVYFIVNNPFENGLDLTEVKEKLDAEISRLGLEIDSEFGVVGGLYVY